MVTSYQIGCLEIPLVRWYFICSAISSRVITIEVSLTSAESVR